MAPGVVEVTDLPVSARGRLPRYPLAVLRLGRGVGSLLLVTVFELAHELMDTLSGALADRPEPTPRVLPMSAIPRLQEEP